MANEIGRRSALRLIGTAPIAVAFTLGANEAATAAEKAATAVKAAAAGKAYVPKFFNPQEWKTVRILVDMIIPKDERSGSATEAGVPEFMDYLMNDPTDTDLQRERRQTAMRGGLAWINSLCERRFGHAFADSPETERTAFSACFFCSGLVIFPTSVTTPARASMSISYLLRLALRRAKATRSANSWLAELFFF